MKRSDVLSVSLKPDLINLLRAEAERQDRPVSRLVNEAISSWAANKKQDDDNG